jgi:hypothetical protein
MIRPLRVDHTKFLQVAIKTHSYIHKYICTHIHTHIDTHTHTHTEGQTYSTTRRLHSYGVTRVLEVCLCARACTHTNTPTHTLPELACFPFIYARDWGGERERKREKEMRSIYTSTHMHRENITEIVCFHF